METTQEGLLVIRKGGVPVAVVIRDEKCSHQVIHLIEVAGMEDLEKLMTNHE